MSIAHEDRVAAFEFSHGGEPPAAASDDGIERLLSTRSMHRMLRVARTIADLAGSTGLLGPHVAEAIGYRRGERAVAARVA